PDRGIHRGHGVFPGSRHTGDLRPRVPGRASRGAALAKFPTRTRRRGRPLLVPASISNARVLAIPDGLDGFGSVALDLPGAVQSVSSRARISDWARTEGVGVLGRR